MYILHLIIIGRDRLLRNIYDVYTYFRFVFAECIILLMNDHIMAQSNFDDIQLDSLTVCPVCFQKFNIPRILPCSHTFCHDCLDGHIKSSTKSKPLGFACPLCREFITAPGVVGQCASDKWSEHFPINKLIVSLSGKCNDLIPLLFYAMCVKKMETKKLPPIGVKIAIIPYAKIVQRCTIDSALYKSMSLFLSISKDFLITNRRVCHCFALLIPSVGLTFSVEITRWPYVPYVYQYCIGHVSILVP